MIDPSLFELSAEQLQEIFDRKVRPVVFAHARPDPRPSLVLCGGQAGSGKTRVTRRLRRQYAAAGTSLLVLNVDSLRAAHPAYAQLIKQDPPGATAATQSAIGVWLEKSIAYARSAGYSILIEGTFRTPDVALGEADRFHLAGYRTHMVALAVPAQVSRLSTLSRYVDDALECKVARWTSLASHEAGLVGTPATVAAAESRTSVDRLTIVNRDGKVLFDREREAGLIVGASDALDAGRVTPLSQAAASAWLQNFHEHVAFATATDLLSAETRPLFEQLSVDARSMIGTAYPTAQGAVGAHAQLDDDVRRLKVDPAVAAATLARTGMTGAGAFPPRHRRAPLVRRPEEPMRESGLER